jgi:hypothetical protein
MGQGSRVEGLVLPELLQIQPGLAGLLRALREAAGMKGLHGMDECSKVIVCHKMTVNGMRVQ